MSQNSANIEQVDFNCDDYYRLKFLGLHLTQVVFYFDAKKQSSVTIRKIKIKIVVAVFQFINVM